MRGRRFRRAVDLDQHEPGSIVLLLHHVEARDSGLLNTRAGVLDGSLPEVRHRLGLDVCVHVNNKHRNCLRSLSYSSGV